MWPEGYNKPGICDTKVFYALQSGTLDNDWQIWNKPAGVGMVNFTMIGSGGAGGKGSGGTSGFASGGGGCGGITRLLVPAVFLPDVLYVRPGKGTPTQTASGTGFNSSTSYIAITPVNPSVSGTASNIILSMAGAASGTGGNGGTSGGAGAVATGTNDAIGLGLGIWESIGGFQGSAGATAVNTSGANNSPSNNLLPLTSGAGGGIGTGNGGFITSLALWPTISGGVGTTGGTGTAGFRSGYKFGISLGAIDPIAFSGGTGGGGHSTGQAGDGGPGAYGCGGGGGGNTTGAGGLAGNGGAGGDGVVIITSW